MSENPYRGSLRRRIRKDKHNSRANLENQKMVEQNKSINIDWWDLKSKPNTFCFIRLNLKKALIPNEGFHEDLILVLEEVVNGYIQR